MGYLTTFLYIFSASCPLTSIISYQLYKSTLFLFIQVENFLGAHGGAFEHEATRRMQNEFVAAWDGLRSKDSQRIPILGATYRPFDLDDVIILRLP